MLPPVPVFPAPLLARTWDCQPQPERDITFSGIQLLAISEGRLTYNSVLLRYLLAGIFPADLRMFTWASQYRVTFVQPDPEDQGTWYFDFNHPIYVAMLPYYFDGSITPLGARCLQATFPQTAP